MRRAVSVHAAGRWPPGESVGCATLAYDDRHRRRLRLATDAGEPFLLDLPDATVLDEGDGLALDGGGYILVRAAAEPVLEVRAASPELLLRLAWHIGNRHIPAELGRDCLRIREDHVIAEMIMGLGGEVSAATTAFRPEGGAYGGGRGPAHAAGHEHGHSHSHEHGHER